MRKVYVLKGEDWLRRKLQKNFLEVTFTKVNGETRVMNCTLHPEHVPFKTKTTDRTRAPIPGLISVVDVDLNEWRGFYYDTVTRVERIEKL